MNGIGLLLFIVYVVIITINAIIFSLSMGMLMYRLINYIKKL